MTTILKIKVALKNHSQVELFQKRKSNYLRVNAKKRIMSVKSS